MLSSLPVPRPDLRTYYKAIIHAPIKAAPTPTIGTPLLPLIPSDVVLVLVTVVEPPSIVVVAELFLVVLPAFFISCSDSWSIAVRVGMATVIDGSDSGAVYSMTVLATAELVRPAGS